MQHKKWLKFGDVSQWGTPHFAEAFFKIKNAISHLIFVISTKDFSGFNALRCALSKKVVRKHAY